MPTLPVDHDVARLPRCRRSSCIPSARPFSQSMTAFGASARGRADRRASLRRAGARRLRVDDREAARHPVVDQRARDVLARGFGRNGGLRGARRRRPPIPASRPRELAIAGCAGEIRPRFVDHRNLSPSVSVCRGRVTSTCMRSLLPSPSDRTRSRPTALANPLRFDPGMPARSAPGHRQIPVSPSSPQARSVPEAAGRGRGERKNHQRTDAPES